MLPKPAVQKVVGLCTWFLDEAAEMVRLCAGEIITSVEGATEILATSHSGEDRGWKDMLCSQGRAKAGSHHYNLLNINKIQKYSHKNEQN